MEMLESMIRVQRHRGPDDSGMYIARTDGIGLGHNRLSIIDLSAAGRQPMSSPEGDLWITFNGEIYNYRELKDELNDYPYVSGTDTEVILAAYRRWGEKLVERFIGMFAFAIWDSPRRRLFCARDRMGVKPFNYTWLDGSFVFASEIKALLAAGKRAEPDWETWAVYLTHGYYDHSDRTFFDGVFSLPPGHTLVLEDGRVKIKSYWSLPEKAMEIADIGDSDAAGGYLELLKDSARLRMRSDVPVGVNLSGGLDSASLAAALGDALEPGGEIVAFTASFDDTGYDETGFALEALGGVKWKRNVARLRPDEAWDAAREAVLFQEAPFGGVSTLAYHKLHALARELGVTVLLEGQGVDETIAGYDYFRRHHYLDILAAGGREALKTELEAAGSGERVNEITKESLEAEIRRPLYQDGTSHLAPGCVSRDMTSLAGEPPEFPKPFGDNLRNALYRDLRYTKLPRVLRMNDRLSMAHSRELRQPFIDHRLVEFAFRLPGRMKIREGMSKYILRKAMEGRLPDTARLARKRAVVTPQREWLRGPLRQRVEELLRSASFTQRGLFDADETMRVFVEFVEGGGSNSFFVWQWINAEMWFNAFIDSGSAVNAMEAR